MAALIIAFPPARRIDFVERHARLMADMRPEVADGHLRRQLDIQRDALRRKQVPEANIAIELRRLESAVRAALWKVIFAPGSRA